MKRLLLAAAAISAFVVPAVSSAQDRDGDRGGGNRGAEMRSERAPPNVGQIRRGVPNPGFQGQGAQQRPDFQGQRQAQAQREDRPNFAQGQNRPDVGQRQDPPGVVRQAPRGPQGQVGRVDPRFDNRNDPRFDNRNDGRYDSRNDPRFNDRNSNRYDSRGPVFSRSNPNWWRGRPEFRGYTGVRNGFWFLPSYGYIRPDARYYNYAWRSGDFVPRTYWQYVVADPFIYGLDWPPPGYQWVYLGRDIVLMDTYSGRIVQVFNGYF